MAGFPRNGRCLVYVARHGETDWNAAGRLQGHTDVPLNDRGRAQARALAGALTGEGIGSILASDLSRAKETAEIVAAALGLRAPAVDPRLRERSFGELEGRTKEYLLREEAEAWASLKADFGARPPGGESREDLAARMLAASLDAARAFAQPAAPVLVVSHGASIRALLFAATGVRVPPLGNGTVYRLVFGGAAFEAAELVWSAEPPAP